MKITRDTPEQMILEKRPVARAVLVALFGLAFALFALVLPKDAGALKLTLYLVAAGFGAGSLLTLERVQMVMDRSSGAARMSRRTWRGLEVAEFALQDLQSFRLDPYVDKNTPRHMHFAVTGGETAGSYVFCLWNPMLEKKAAAQINRINAWIGRAHLSERAPAASEQTEEQSAEQTAAQPAEQADEQNGEHTAEPMTPEGPAFEDERIAFEETATAQEQPEASERQAAREPSGPSDEPLTDAEAETEAAR
ncbi:hypothetical protein [Litorivita sp. NS0012-18]|uniref:hypothetical protein n=1 Tax=Litorivita sp. NS0012-18 TaxID=3127655 RepID=UPI0031057D63